MQLNNYIGQETVAQTEGKEIKCEVQRGRIKPHVVRKGAKYPMMDLRENPMYEGLKGQMFPDQDSCL